MQENIDQFSTSNSTEFVKDNIDFFQRKSQNPTGPIWFKPSTEIFSTRETENYGEAPEIILERVRLNKIYQTCGVSKNENDTDSDLISILQMRSS